MGTGLLLGLIAALLWSITNVIDQHLVDTYAYDGNVGGVLLLSTFFPIILVFLSLLGINTFTFNYIEILLLLLSGVLMTVWLFFYLKALTEDSAPIVLTLLVLTPVCSFILEALFLNIVPTSQQIGGGVIIITGSLLVAYNKNQGIKTKLLLYAATASLAMAALHTIFKFATVANDFWHSMFWRSVGIVTSGLLIYVCVSSYRKNFHSFIKKHFKSGLTLNTTNETLTLVGDSVFAFAILFAPIALIQTTESYQPIFIIIITYTFIKFGLIKHSKFSSNFMINKTLGMLLVIFGTVVMLL